MGFIKRLGPASQTGLHKTPVAGPPYIYICIYIYIRETCPHPILVSFLGQPLGPLLGCFSESRFSNGCFLFIGSSSEAEVAKAIETCGFTATSTSMARELWMH